MDTLIETFHTLFPHKPASCQPEILVVNGMYVDFARAALLIETDAELIVCYRDRPRQTVPRATLADWYTDIRRCYAHKFIPPATAEDTAVAP